MTNCDYTALWNITAATVNIYFCVRFFLRYRELDKLVKAEKQRLMRVWANDNNDKN